MSATKFWILLVMSLTIVMLVSLEIWGTKRVTNLTDEITTVQNKIGRAQQQQDFLRNLVQRVVTDSRNDPALADLLARNGVTITRSPAPDAAPAPATKKP